MTTGVEPISCSLTPAAAADQVLEWRDLEGVATAIDAEGGRGPVADKGRLDAC